MEIELPKEMRMEYLQRREKDLQDLTVALANLDWTVLRTIGHQLKGNGESYGFPSLGAIGKDLEEAAKQTARKRAEDILNKFSTTVKKLTAELAQS